MEDIKRIIQSYKPNNRKITNDTYAYKIRLLIESKIDLENPKEVEEVLDGKKFKTKRSYYIALVVYLKALNKNSKPYEIIVKNMGEEIEKQDKKNEKTDNLVSRKEIEMIIANIEQNLTKVSQNNTRYYRTLQDYLILNLYYLIPPIRNDYVAVDVYESLPLLTSSQTNYISLYDKKLYLNRYKTDKKYGALVLDIPEKIIGIIRQLLDKRRELQINNMHALLLNADLKRMTKTNLIHNLNRIFGKKVSVTVLRKSYISEKYPVVNTVEDMEEDAKKMGHSVAMQQSTYRKRI